MKTSAISNEQTIVQMFGETLELSEAKSLLRVASAVVAVREHLENPPESLPEAPRKRRGRPRKVHVAEPTVEQG